MRRIAPAMAALLVTLVSTIYGQQPRDNRLPVHIGSGGISGVVSLDGERRPLRRARVTLVDAELDFSQTAITGDEGAFAFERLPPGRYSLRASKDGYVSTSFGAARPGRPGKTILLGVGATSRVDLRLSRGSVITGTVLAPDGDPAAGVSVTVLTSRYEPASGDRRMTLAPNGSAITDDRGVYRIFGLPAGSYLVAALARLPFVGLGDVQLISAAEIRAALADVRERRAASRPGIPIPPRSAPAAATPRRSVVFSPIFYPGTAVQAQALPIELESSEVRREVNMDLEYVPTATVEGTVTVPAGMRAQVLLGEADRTATNQARRVSASADEDGRFAFRLIPPGTYTISARAFPAGVRTGAAPAESLQSGETNVVVSGEDITGVTLALGPAVTISGGVVFESTSGSPPELGLLRISLQAFAVGSNSAPLPTVVIEDSSFRLSGVLPGIYRFFSPPRGIRASVGRWWLKSLTLRGREMLDQELELRQSVEDGILTFSDRASELAGVVRRSDGTLVTDGYVVVFSTQKSAWFHGSRRVAGARLSDDGRYVVRNLPAGEYLLAITHDLELNEWFDPDVLRTLATSSPSRLSLAEYEARAHDISLAR
ncbi:MAG: carboxypeptidase regulatory-like domain-containing protein [Acidobacteria bacterium]|nr:carboxypeptidase regulatory-like domain-containing protein [Acidobacteriota bacterium]